MSTKYRVHRSDIKMTSDQNKLEQFLNSLEGEIIALIPNVTWFPGSAYVNFLLIVEKVGMVNTDRNSPTTIQEE